MLIIYIAILARLPRNSIHITVALRVRLLDNACVCLLITKSPQDSAELMKLCIRRQHQLAKYPFLLLSFVLEYRLASYESWLDRLWSRVDKLEVSTGMTAWPRAEDLEPNTQDYGPMLQELHAVNVELLVAETTMKFGRTFVDFCRKTLEITNESRKRVGLPEMPSSERQKIEVAIAFNARLAQFRDDKFRELLNRVQSQINVTFSLVTQQDSRTNTRIAESAARDNQTMKTITVITLLFLPSTLLAVSIQP
ncbi:hypothetical protein BT63DRAFT_168540 [Microthyrium microscopicum]|uniref:Uncharacterized protein n=1 Tax=Microthyrium microscopicum TaxID=703497 RepID=A0A6A6UQ47_9PEZI|nr:hypothetical protein BT63DRAFT_168540 [Microthyrium microscopicum]